MSDFETFTGFNTADQMDEQAFEQFKERMKANAAQIKAIQVGEQKQKKQEDRLLKILLKFIKKHQKSDIVLLISRALEDNIPAVLILSIILLGNKEVQEEVGVHLKLPDTTSDKTANEFNHAYAIVHFDPQNRALPLEVKITFDLWGKNIYEICTVYPHKILGASFDHEKKVKQSLVNLTAAIVRDYLAEKKLTSDPETRLKFAKFLLTSILEKINQDIDKQKTIKGKVEE